MTHSDEGHEYEWVTSHIRYRCNICLRVMHWVVSHIHECVMSHILYMGLYICVCTHTNTSESCIESCHTYMNVSCHTYYMWIYIFVWLHTRAPQSHALSHVTHTWMCHVTHTICGFTYLCDYTHAHLRVMHWVVSHIRECVMSHILYMDLYICVITHTHAPQSHALSHVTHTWMCHVTHMGTQIESCHTHMNVSCHSYGDTDRVMANTHECVMSHTREYFISHTHEYVMSLISTCVQFACVWHDSCVCDMTPSVPPYEWHDTFMCVWHDSICASIWVTWHIHVCVTWLHLCLHMSDMTPSCVCDMTPSVPPYEWHDTFMCVWHDSICASIW